MAQDKIGGIVRALVGVPQERLTVIQRIVNGLNSAAQHGDQFQLKLSQFVLNWKPEASHAALDNPDLARWSDNYFKLFGKRPDLSQVRIPEKPEGFGPMRLVVVAKELLEWTKNFPMEGVQKALKKHFLGWEYASNLDVDIPTNDRDPKNGSYAVWVKDAQEADEENANKSANDLLAENHVGITAQERQLLEVDYFFEKGDHLDRASETLCTGSRCRGGDDVPSCGYDGFGRLVVIGYYAASRGPSFRSRRVWA